MMTNGQCVNYHGSVRCQNEIAVRMYDPNGKPVPGCFYCPQCADATITEYREKLGELWTAKEVKMRESHSFAEELLESLKQTVASLEYWLPRYGDPEGVNSQMMINARAAIAKGAEEGRS